MSKKSFCNLSARNNSSTLHNNQLIQIIGTFLKKKYLFKLFSLANLIADDFTFSAKAIDQLEEVAAVSPAPSDMVQTEYAM